MYNYIVPKLQNFKLQMQYMVNLLTLSDSSLSNITSQKIFVSDDMNPDLDPVQEIARVSREASEFFTTIQCLCDLDPMFVSSNLPSDPSADLASREIVVSSDLAPDLDPVQAIAPVFSETSNFFTLLQCDLEPEINKYTSSKIEKTKSIDEL